MVVQTEKKEKVVEMITVLLSHGSTYAEGHPLWVVLKKGLKKFSLEELYALYVLVLTKGGE